MFVPGAAYAIDAVLCVKATGKGAPQFRAAKTSPPTPATCKEKEIQIGHFDGTTFQLQEQQPPTAYVHSTPAPVAIGAVGGLNGAATINPMFLPAGTYLVTFTGTIVNFGPSPDLFRCAIYVSGAVVAANAVDLGEAMTVAPMTVQTVLTVTSGGTTAVGSTCLHDNNLPSGGTPYYVDPGATLTAVPIVTGS